MKICPACQRCYEDTVLSCIEENHDSLVEARPGGREIVADYRLNFLLECDATSETYAATSIPLDEPCAVKVVDANLTGIGQQLREQFQSEARTAAAIDHPNVIRVCESGVLEGSEFYVVTEPAEGQTLREYINGVGSPSEQDAVTIARQTAEGLAAAHAAGVQHRNLNPASIILTSSPENALSVKIQNFDFGSVRQAAASAVYDSEPHLERLRYSSPEQCAAQTTDERTDIYSLGVVLYEMLEGRPPFDTPDAAELIRRQINEQPPPVKISNFDVRALLTHTLMQALQKNPTRRLTANAFARQLRHIEQLMTRSPMPVRVSNGISAPNAISSDALIAENDTAAAKFDDAFSKEIRAFVPETAETLTVNSAATKQSDLLSEAVRENRIFENVSPAQPELIFVRRKKADAPQPASEFGLAESEPTEDVPFKRETVPAESEEFDYAGVASEPLRLEDESVVDSSHPESVVSPAASIEETSAQPAKANLLFSDGAGRGRRQFIKLSRPLLAGASVAALLVSAILGVLLNDKFQLSAAPPSIAAVPVPESESSPKFEEPILIEPKSEEPILEEPILIESGSTITIKNPETEGTDIPDLEKYTPVKFEKPAPTSSFRGNKSQPLKEKTADKTPAKQDTSPIKIPATKENVNKAKGKEFTAFNKKHIPKKQISALPERDIFMRPRIVNESGARGKN